MYARIVRFTDVDPDHSVGGATSLAVGFEKSTVQLEFEGDPAVTYRGEITGFTPVPVPVLIMLALVVLSALLAHYQPRPADAVKPAGTAPKPSGAKIPELPPMAALDPEVAALVQELNAFGEDTEPQLIASMYRHLAYWPTYLALVRTMLAPLQREGRLNALTLSTRALGHAHGAVLASQLKPATPPDTLKGALASCRLFVEHPIVRMTGLCAMIRRATPE